MIYFLGIGGIGMSALANWCQRRGISVAGYDRQASTITRSLEQKGVSISYRDDKATIPIEMLQAGAGKLVVFTPAVPQDSEILQTLMQASIPFMKRSQFLGMITEPFYTVAVAGTHGKTTTSSMIGHMLKQSSRPATAFIGGITQNYSTNLLLEKDTEQDQVMIVEADEYDRSFLTLRPDIAVVTAVDADHLDIYGDFEHLLQGFKEFLGCLRPGGKVFINQRVVDLLIDSVPSGVTLISYGIQVGDIRADHIGIHDGKFIFDFQSPEINMEQLNSNMPGFHNVENAMAAIAVGWSLGLDEKEIRRALASYTGVKRRFEFIINQPDLVFIDDYAHHPVEIKALLFSVSKLYPGKKVTAVFQPHLYSRTRDLYVEFASSLSLASEVVLMDIYPAREKPIAGITSNMIAKELTVPYSLTNEDSLCDLLAAKDLEVLLTIGAGDIDQMVEPIKKTLLSHEN